MSNISRVSGKRTNLSTTKTNNPKETSVDVSQISSIKDRSVKEKILENYYKNSVHLRITQVFLRNASPYLSEEDKKNYEYKENKQKWISKDFVKYTSNKYEFIPNYVNLDEFKNSPLNHKFRDINKKKWVGSNFYLQF